MTPDLPSVVCPVDFSEASRSALSYAAVIATHFGARLTVLTVDDPLLAEAAKASGFAPSVASETEAELRRFCRETLAPFASGPERVEFRVAVGKPATEILRWARLVSADLMVMSSHGRSGMRRRFFGSTTERVLRETTVPVLIPPGHAAPATSLSDIARRVHRVIAPVDLMGAPPAHLRIAGGIAQALSVPLIVAHVVEPVFIPYNVRIAVPRLDAARRTAVDEQLAQLTAGLGEIRAESLVLTGEPSEEIVKLAEARQANLIVMGLHSAGCAGPRMGSVTYRVLCLTGALVLAVPPRVAASGSAATHAAQATVEA